MGKVFVGDVGTKIRFELKFEGITVTQSDISSVKIKYRKPNGEVGQWTATIEDDSHVYYVTKQGDIDIEGQWILQPYIVLNTGWSGYGTAVILKVYYPDVLQT